MRISLVLAVVLCAGVCHAEDPLESLNTVEDTVLTMKRTLSASADQARGDDSAPTEESFVSTEPLGDRAWVRVTSCDQSGEPEPVQQGALACTEGDQGEATKYYWRARMAAPADLKSGALVIAPAQGCEAAGSQQGWIMTRVTDPSELHKGWVELSVPCRVRAGRVRSVLE